MNILQSTNLCFAYDRTPVLGNVSLNLTPGKIFALLGPNGSGKSTLLKVLLGHLHGSGVIKWNDRALCDWPRSKLARLVAYLPQASVWDPAQTVADALRLGRAPYWGPLGLESADDAAVLHNVAASMELTDLMDRRMDQLSGGQRQRVLLGRCLAQEPRAMLLDEPDTYLDLKHQLDLCRLLRDLAQSRGMALLVASHDLNLAAMFADEAMLLRQGTVAATGTPSDVLKPELLQEVYGVAMERIDRPGKSPVLVPQTI